MNEYSRRKNLLESYLIHHNDLRRALHRGEKGGPPQARYMAAHPAAAFYASYELGKGNRAYAAYEDLWTFLLDYAPSAFQPDTHVHELIQPDVPVKLYVDIDSLGAQDIATLIDVLAKGILSSFGATLKKTEFMVDPSHSDDGDTYSYHIVSAGKTRFANTTALNTWMKSMQDELSPFPIDMSVYSKNHLMRVVGSTKYGEVRYLGDHIQVTTTQKGLITANIENS